MTQFNSTPISIFSASERELLTLSMAEIINGLIEDYKSFSQGFTEGIHIPEKTQEPRMSHSCILYEEGLRMAHTRMELAKKLILASLFDFTVQAKYWFELKKKMEDKGEEEYDLLKAISELSHYSTRAFAWIKENGGADLLENLLKSIKDFEDYKEKERKKS